MSLYQSAHCGDCVHGLNMETNEYDECILEKKESTFWKRVDMFKIQFVNFSHDNALSFLVI